MKQRITTDRLTLRMLRSGDLAPYLTYCASPRTGGVGGPQPEHKVCERFCAMIGQWALRGFGRLAICHDPDAPAIGHVGPMQYDGSPAEITWTLWSDTHEGRGYATEAARAVLADLFANNWRSIVAHIDTDNAKSHAVARRLGGEPTGAAPAPWMPNGIQYRFTVEGAG
ncbi:GNAT family N-acetyltransferase [Gymnodinialimonas sp. 2305UL16-5]|uniref:GNAT family N-acetyltransferase n=1 Tax=Gymnodinialimonas mytili TaxID=3126503 RepID=UPI0030A108BD